LNKTVLKLGSPTPNNGEGRVKIQRVCRYSGNSDALYRRQRSEHAYYTVSCVDWLCRVPAAIVPPPSPSLLAPRPSLAVSASRLV